MSKYKEEKPPIYTKFINQQNVLNVGDDKKVLNIISRSSFFVVLAQFSGAIATTIGFNFEHAPAIVTFIIEVSLVIGSLILLIKQYLVIHKYKIFKKERYFWFIYLLNYVLLIAIYISAYFNTTFEMYDDGKWLSHINPVYYIFIFIPLIVLYIVLLENTVNKGIREMTTLKEKKYAAMVREHKEIIEDMKSLYKDDEQDIEIDGFNDIDK